MEDIVDEARLNIPAMPADGHMVLSPQQLKALRLGRALSQEAFAEYCSERRLCVSVASIKRAESGKSILYRTARHLAVAYDVPLTALIPQGLPPPSDANAVGDLLVPCSTTATTTVTSLHSHDRFSDTAELLSVQGPTWWRTWQAEAIDATCRQATVDPASGHPDIAYWRALAAMMRGSADALAYLERAHTGYAAADNAAAQAVCAHAALVLCLLDHGAMDHVSTWLARAREADWPDTLGNDIASLWMRMGALARVVLGKDTLPAADLAAAWLHAQLRPLRDRLSPDERLIAAQVLVNYHFVQQRYEQFDFLTALVEDFEPFNAASPLMRARWLYTVGFAHYQIDGHTCAEQSWQRAIALAEVHGLSNLHLLTSLALVRLLIDRRCTDAAHAILESIRPAWGAGRARQLIELQQMRARVHLLREQPALALATLLEVLALAKEAGLSAPEQATFFTDQSQMLVALGRIHEACALLQQLAQDHSGRDAEVYRCLHGLLQAWQCQTSDEPASRALLSEALARAQASRYTMFLRLLPTLAAQICSLALRWQVEPVFVREVIVGRALSAPAPPGQTHLE